ncbi:MAG: hypothetical protein H6765_00660 [Candidatus Peribacteria bacterium]|nr:MAG: hypothetical protein H6765_00660 [Candidatus Peribacteria bacterium]
MRNFENQLHTVYQQIESFRVAQYSEKELIEYMVEFLQQISDATIIEPD